MITTIDKEGRVVIPAQIRSAAGLRPGMKLEIVLEGSSVRLTPNVPRPELVRQGERWIARPTSPLDERSQVDAAELVAEERSMTPSLFAQPLLRERFEQQPRHFSSAFAGLAGSWEDERSAEEICRDLEEESTCRRRVAPIL